MKPTQIVGSRTRVAAVLLLLALAVGMLCLASFGVVLLVKVWTEVLGGKGSPTLGRDDPWMECFIAWAFLLAPVLLILGSGLLAYFFLSGMAFVLRNPRPTAAQIVRSAERSRRADRRLRRTSLGALFLGCAGLLYLLGIAPLVQIVGARSWMKTPCTVISSTTESTWKRGDKHRTERLSIVYGYSVGEQKYQGDRYGFAEVASDRVAWHAAVIRRYPPGSTNVCYVNPRDPEQAVLERGGTADMWWALLPLGGMLLTALVWLASSERQPSGCPPGLWASRVWLPRSRRKPPTHPA